MSGGPDGGGFLARWSRRKSEQRQGIEPAPEPVRDEPAAVAPRSAPGPDQTRVVAPQPTSAGTVPQPQPQLPPPPTLADAEALTPGSEVTRFLAPNVDPGVKNAALKKLFADPHYNIMDGLDTYIDDYSKPDPIPPEMLRQMVQSKFLGLFDDEEKDETSPQPQQAAAANAAAADIPAPSAAPAPEADNPAPHEDATLRLQPDDAARPGGPGEGTRPRSG